MEFTIRLASYFVRRRRSGQVCLLFLAIWCAATALRASQDGQAASSPSAARNAIGPSTQTPPAFDVGRRPDSLFSRDYVSLLWDDTRGILSSPIHWNQFDWLLAGGLGAATAGSAVFDAKVRQEAQRDTGHIPDRFFNQWQNFGAQYSLLVLGGFEAFGVVADNPRSRAVAMDGFTASVIASGIVTPLIKYSVGRVRPNATARTFSFKPFSGNVSFPSGHVTQAFAVATVIADHYDAWWQQSLAYGTAALVGWGRIDSNSHFVSDVVGGAAIGWAVGHAVVQRHNAAPGAKVTWHFTPWSDGQQTGLILSRRF